jgi:hypothetical protein
VELTWRRPSTVCLLKSVGAAFGAVEGGLKAVADVEDQVDGADGVGAGGDAFAVAVCFKMEHGGAGGKDAPVHGSR